MSEVVEIAIFNSFDRHIIGIFRDKARIYYM